MSDSKPNTSYTDEQRVALAKTYKPGLRLNAAKAKFANHVLYADGKIDDNVGALVKNIDKAVKAAIAAGSDEVTLRKAADLAAKKKEVENHIEQKRFLFVLDKDDVPVIYFQCAVPNNPDVE